MEHSQIESLFEKSQAEEEARNRELFDSIRRKEGRGETLTYEEVCLWQAREKRDEEYRREMYLNYLANQWYYSLKRDKYGMAIIPGKRGSEEDTQ